jgi:23S rRNA (cytidine1920-2'-O)/16S rRNA (cytidine1409-2'-O)-methyltransferase
MARSRRPRLRPLAAEVAAQFPHLENPVQEICAGRVLVGGIPARNPRSLVRAGSRLALARERRLRGAAKLEPALEAFGVAVAGRVALDLGAAAGGFTSVLVARGAARVYAVDAGHGQLRGRLRQHPTVVNLERTNLAGLSPALVPQPVDLVTADLSYLGIAAMAPQLERLRFAPGADMVALVKPMYELGLDRPPADPALRRRAVEQAAAGLNACGWTPLRSIESPMRGARGAVEHLLHARRTGAG